MNNKINKKKIAIISIIVLTVIALGIGLTYAYFTADVEGNDTASTIKVKSGKLVIDFGTSEYINNTSGQLIDDSNPVNKKSADYSKFTIKHAASSKKAATYILSLTDLEISSNLAQSQDFKWELVKVGNNNTETTINSGNFTSLGEAHSMVITNSPQNLPVGNVDTFIFRIWIAQTQEDQSELSNGIFRGKISLEAKSV